MPLLSSPCEGDRVGVGRASRKKAKQSRDCRKKEKKKRKEKKKKNLVAFLELDWGALGRA